MGNTQPVHTVNAGIDGTLGSGFLVLDLKGITAYIGAGNDVNAVMNVGDSAGDTLLHLVASGTARAQAPGEDVAAVELLLNAKAKLDPCNQSQKTPLCLAAENGRLDCVRLLLSRGADPNGSSLADTDGLSHVAYLQGPDSAVNDNVSTQRVPPLHAAAAAGRAKAIAVLARNGANIFAQDTRKYDRSALHVAAIGGHERCIRALLHFNADPSVVDQYGRTPLHEAAASHIALEYQARSVADLLLEANADPSSADTQGNTPLHCAASAGHASVASALLQAGADVTSIGLLGYTALHAACSIIAAPSLIHHEPDISSRRNGADSDDRDAAVDVDESVATLRTTVVQLLLAHGAKTNAIARDGTTPLHCAAASGNIDLVQLLLEAGAEAYITDRQGRTPLDAWKVSRFYSDNIECELTALFNDGRRSIRQDARRRGAFASTDTEEAHAREVAKTVGERDTVDTDAAAIALQVPGNNSNDSVDDDDDASPAHVPESMSKKKTRIQRLLQKQVHSELGILRLDGCHVSKLKSSHQVVSADEEADIDNGVGGSASADNNNFTENIDPVCLDASRDIQGSGLDGSAVSLLHYGDMRVTSDADTLVDERGVGVFDERGVGVLGNEAENQTLESRSDVDDDEEDDESADDGYDSDAEHIFGREFGDENPKLLKKKKNRQQQLSQPTILPQHLKERKSGRSVVSNSSMESHGLVASNRVPCYVASNGAANGGCGSSANVNSGNSTVMTGDDVHSLTLTFDLGMSLEMGVEASDHLSSSSDGKTCEACTMMFSLRDPGYTPRVLPCGHVFCSQCITKLVERNNIHCIYRCKPSRLGRHGVFGLDICAVAVIDEVAESVDMDVPAVRLKPSQYSNSS